MALARGILLWLPLQRLLDRYWPGPRFSEIVALRPSAVNQLSFSELEYWLSLPELQKFRPDLRYVALCTYQGELTKMGDFFLPHFYLRRRALFLQDASLLEYFVAGREIDYTSNGVQEMFESNNPSIWASLLSNSLVTPADPYAFAWTDGLQNYFRRELPRLKAPDEDEYILAGTLGLLDLWDSEPNELQVLAYLRRLVRDTPDGFLAGFGPLAASYPNLSSLLAQADAINSLLEPGPKDSATLLAALVEVRPNTLRLLLPRLGSSAVPRVRIDAYVTREVVRRAELILTFLPDWPELESYREQLLLITGQPARQPELWPDLLLRLAHPQLAQLRDLPGPLEEPYPVLYQPELWLTALAKNVLRGAFASRLYDPRLYAWGLFLPLRRLVGQDFSKPWRADPFDVPTPEARTPNSQRMTRAHFRLLLEYGIPLPSLRSLYFPLLEDAEAAQQLYPPSLELENKVREAEEREHNWVELLEELAQ